MVDSMQNEMQVSHELAISEVVLAVEDETMDQVLCEGEHEEAEGDERKHEERVGPSPVDFESVVDDN